LASGASQAVLDSVRALLGALAAPVVASATLLQDLLVCRLLAPHVAPLRAACERLWAELRPTLLERAAHAPRIWAT
ncbi:MAG: urease accessory protein UreD, partial [Gammaproteobacteria bacterium]|nr:urease accessory protein UreD [Gammaproteobacteria bacterium]